MKHCWLQAFLSQSSLFRKASPCSSTKVIAACFPIDEIRTSTSKCPSFQSFARVYSASYATNYAVEIRNLMLSVPVKDDNGKLQQLTVERLYWGCSAQGCFIIPDKALQNARDLPERVPHCKRSLFVEGLPVTNDLEELHAIETKLYEVFADFEPELINMVPGHGCSFVKLVEIQQVELAVAALDGTIISSDESEKYRLRMRPIDM